MERRFPAKHKTGWIIIFFCGIFGTLNGVISYASSLHSILDHTTPWKTGAGMTTLTLQQLMQWNPELGPYWVLVNMVAWVNLTFTGVVLASSAWIGIRNGHKLGWWCAFTVWLWVGLNDSIGVLAVYQMTSKFIPTAPLPSAIGAIGLLLAYPGVFRSADRAGSEAVAVTRS